MIEQKVTNYCNGEKCSMCGRCCTAFIPVSEKEIDKIYKYLNAHKEIIAEVEKKLEDIISNKDFLKIECCFYRDNKCLIYPVRPFICKKFKCNQSKEEIQANKNFAIGKAKYNKTGINDLNDFWKIFFGKDFMIKNTLGNFGISEESLKKIKINRF